MCVLELLALLRIWQQIHLEVHYSRFTIHPRFVTMYYDIYKSYGWPGLKKNMLDVGVKMSCLLVGEG